MDKQSLLELLADNQLGELFNALKHKQGYYKDLILLESKWNDLRTKQRNDLISNEQANIELGQIRHSLLQLIDLSDGQPAPFASPTPTGTGSNRTWIMGAIALVGLLAVYGIYRFASAPTDSEAAKANNGRSPATLAAPGNKAAPARPLNVSEAQPVTMSAGSEQYERVYSVIKTNVESIGGGKSLITLRIGLNFKGIINHYLRSGDFRLFADELPGPLAPSNFLSEIVDSRSYGEGDIKFELDDSISRFTVVVEGKEDKKWIFTR
ncbi:MAG: hypothetical protein IPH31_09415 [Lewinellaceae bacterium]|nr:hypothetical protein [Lewinellaceae bacterium]